jgi:hypothetical protein
VASGAVDNLVMKIDAKLTHRMHPCSTVLDTWVEVSEKLIKFNGLRGFSTETRETITTSF